MISEAQRRAYLGAMQVDSWLPRVALPFAAPSNAALLTEALSVALVETSPVTAPQPPASTVSSSPRPRIEAPRPKVRSEAKPTLPVVQPSVDEAEKPTLEPQINAITVAPPRFALQLLRAGDCLLLVELPTGEGFQGRDPAYLLLRDLLRAAQLPDSPLQVGGGEPIRWPLLRRGNLDQGPAAASDYVQGVLAAQAQQGALACVWLVGRAALRFAGDVDEQHYNRELNIEGIGPAWGLPGLELLMDEPIRKAELWQAMQRVMPRWVQNV